MIQKLDYAHGVYQICSVCYKRVAIQAMSHSAQLLLSMLSFFWRNGVETPEPLKADVTGKVSVVNIFMSSVDSSIR